MPTLILGQTAAAAHVPILVDAKGQALVSLPSAAYSGQKTVTTAGTAEALASTQALASGVFVKALAANTGDIYVGNSDVAAANGFVLAAGDLVFIEIDDLATVFIDAAENGEGVSYLGS